MRGFVTVLLATLASTAAHAQTVNDQVAKAWADRQARVKSAVFRISATGFFHKGGISQIHSPKEKEQFGILPRADTETSWSQEITLDGNRIRVEEKGTLWAGTEFRYQESIVVLDGTFRRRWEVGGYHVDKPTGLVSKESDYFEAKGQSVKPISRCYRGAAPGFRSFFIDDLKPSGASVVIAGRKCQQFVLRREGGDRNEYWLDPGREWLLVREVYVDSPRGRTQLDIEYEPNVQAGWVPKTWQFRHTGHQTPVCVQKYTVASYDINPPLPESVFDLPFPVGTEVSDFTNGRRDYVVEEGGRERVLLDISQPASRRWWVYVMWGVGVAMVIAVWLVYRRRRAAHLPCDGQIDGSLPQP